MCTCRATTASAAQMRQAQLGPAEPWKMVCQVIIDTLGNGIARYCHAETQGGYGGLHAHHLTVHKTSIWVDVPGHP